MSVALVDQGETVPKRGTTSSNSPCGSPRLHGRPIAQQRLEHTRFSAGELGFDVDEMDEPGLDARDVTDAFAQCSQDFFETKIRERGSAAECKHVGWAAAGQQGRQMIPERAASNQLGAT